MLYAEDKYLTPRPLLYNCPIPIRTFEVTRHWIGLNHGYFADMVCERLQYLGATILREQWNTSPSGAELYAAIDILPPPTVEVPELAEPGVYSLGVRHSNNGLWAISISVGAVFQYGVMHSRQTNEVQIKTGPVGKRGQAAETYAMMTGETLAYNLHFRKVKFRKCIERGLRNNFVKLSYVNEFIRRLKRTPCDVVLASFLMMELHRRNLITFEYLKRIDDAFLVPEHREFRQFSPAVRRDTFADHELTTGTMWQFYMACSSAMRYMPVTKQYKLLTALRPFLEPYLVPEIGPSAAILAHEAGQFETNLEDLADLEALTETSEDDTMDLSEENLLKDDMERWLRDAGLDKEDD